MLFWFAPDGKQRFQLLVFFSFPLLPTGTGYTSGGVVLGRVNKILPHWWSSVLPQGVGQRTGSTSPPGCRTSEVHQHAPPRPTVQVSAMRVAGLVHARACLPSLKNSGGFSPQTKTTPNWLIVQEIQKSNKTLRGASEVADMSIYFLADYFAKFV